jgi:hypothetical protein
MRRVALVAAILATALLVPAGSATAKGKSVVKAVAATTCAKERKAVGAEAFASKYGVPAMPGCKGFVRKLAVNAAKACKQERRELGRSVFANRYGTGKQKRNALGKCVSANVKKSAGQVCPEDLEDLEDLEGEGDELDEEEVLARLFAKCGDDESEAEEDEGDELEDEGDDFEDEVDSDF